MSEKFYEQARLSFQRLSPKKGEIVVVTFPADMSMQQIHATVTFLSQLGDEFGCAVICLGQGVTMEVQSEEEMNALGWYRDPDHKKRILN